MGPLHLLAGFTARQAKPGDIIQLSGPAAETKIQPYLTAQSLRRLLRYPCPSTLTLSGQPATTTFVGLAGNGLSQVNAVMPALPEGDAEVVLQIGTGVSADGAFVNIGNYGIVKDPDGGSGQAASVSYCVDSESAIHSLRRSAGDGHCSRLFGRAIVPHRSL